LGQLVELTFFFFFNTVVIIFLLIRLMFGTNYKKTMKTRIIALFLFAATIPALAGGDGFSKLYRKYAGVEGITSFRIPRMVLRIALLAGDLEKPERDLIRNIDRMWILVVEDPVLNTRINFIDESAGWIRSGEYEEIMRVNEKDENVCILIKETGDLISEMLIVISGEENMMVRIQGDFYPSQIGELASQARKTASGA